MPTTLRMRQRRPAPSVVRSKSSGAHTGHPPSENAQRNYERYLALARAEAQAGNPVEAENYYQHAEHYFRSMSTLRNRSRENEPSD
jgi:hypothetical protein